MTKQELLDEACYQASKYCPRCWIRPGWRCAGFKDRWSLVPKFGPIRSAEFASSFLLRSSAGLSPAWLLQWSTLNF